MIDTLTTFGSVVNEGGSWSFVVDPLLKDDGTPLTPSSLATLTMTIYDAVSNLIINEVSEVDILNTDRGTLTEAGVLTVALYAADNPIVGTVAVGALEKHVIRLHATWDAPNGDFPKEFVVYVKKLATPTAPPAP